VTISGSSDFKLATGSGYCANGEQLAVNASCQIAVTFTPPSKKSTVTATVTITDNAVTSARPTTINPQYIYLSGQ